MGLMTNRRRPPNPNGIPMTKPSAHTNTLGLVQPQNATPTAEAVLKRHGFDGEKLIAYASTIARREMSRKGSTLGDRHEDLIMFLVEAACRTAVKYDPDKATTTSYTFSSYLYDVMERRVPDFYRRKSEGFGDRRKGHDNRIALVERVDADIDADLFAKLIDDDQIARFQAAAESQGTPLGKWILDACETAWRTQAKAA